MLSASTLQWIATAYHDRRNPAGHTLGSLQIVIAGIDRDAAAIEEWMQPANKATIIKTIEAMASLFQVAVPDELGLDLYILALARMPGPVFKAARNNLITTHKWPRLPVPADFISAGQEEQERIDAVRSVLQTARRQAERALLTLR
jgi:predicted transcriptional regulator